MSFHFIRWILCILVSISCVHYIDGILQCWKTRLTHLIMRKKDAFLRIQLEQFWRWWVIPKTHQHSDKLLPKSTQMVWYPCWDIFSVCCFSDNKNNLSKVVIIDRWLSSKGIWVRIFFFLIFWKLGNASIRWEASYNDWSVSNCRAIVRSHIGS